GRRCEGMMSTSAGESTLVTTGTRPAEHDRALMLALLTAFVLSGASGLIFQVVWVRMLALVFGVTAYAISTVLSSFFSGLALGSFLSGRIADRLRSPLRAYAAAETLVAVFGLLTPLAFSLARVVYLGVNEHLAIGGLAPLTALRFVLAFAALLIP